MLEGEKNLLLRASVDGPGQWGWEHAVTKTLFTESGSGLVYRSFWFFWEVALWGSWALESMRLTSLLSNDVSIHFVSLMFVMSESWQGGCDPSSPLTLFMDLGHGHRVCRNWDRSKITQSNESPVRGYYGLKHVPPKFVCWSLNPQDLRLWLYLKWGSLKR